MSKKAVIIDYGMGNVASVQKALAFIGINSEITAEHHKISQADYILLPGVGAFKAGMKKLLVNNLDQVLTEEVIGKQKPFLGICLGMQLLAEKGFEPNETLGLGWIKGTVEKLKIPLRIPHMGWNNIEIRQDLPFYKNLDNQDFYFIHSYHLKVTETKVIAATANYGIDIVASIAQNNIFATQFHPEKSQKSGLQVLKNFFA